MTKLIVSGAYDPWLWTPHRNFDTQPLDHQSLNSWRLDFNQRLKAAMLRRGLLK